MTIADKWLCTWNCQQVLSCQSDQMTMSSVNLESLITHSPLVIELHIGFRHTCNYTVASTHKLHVAYNNVFCLLLNQPKYCSASTTFVEYHLPDSKAVIRNLVYKFMPRLDTSYNNLVIAITNSDIKWQSRIRRHWIKMLYIYIIVFD